MLDRILVPLDGSAMSDRVFALVRRILVRQDAEVILLRVLPEPGGRKGSWDRMQEVDRARGHLRGIANRLAAQGADARWDLRSGEPVAEILQFAFHFRPSLIAMGTHGRTGLARLIRGSVAEGVLRESPYPLLLANVTQQVYQMARAQGLNKQDGAAIVKVFEQMAGVTVKGG